MSTYVIIGNSAGGIGAVEAIRELDKRGSITIISDEPHAAYSRPMIVDYLAGEATFEKMLYRPKTFYAKNDVHAILGKKVVRINFEESYVELDDGEHIEYEKLLLATGGEPFVPEIVGREKDGVFTFTKLADAKKYQKKAEKVKRAVVIGGGLVGFSATAGLAKLKKDVAIVHRRDRILNRILDKDGFRLVERAMKQAGVRIFTKHTVKEIVGDENSVGGVILDDGEEIRCELVVVALGVVPRIELVTESEIKINRGIVVDRFMSTTVPGVYACGDVAEAYDFVYQTNRLMPIWPNAYMGGRTAGSNMAGVKREYPGGTGMNALKYFDLPIVSAGMVNLEEENGYEVLCSFKPDENLYQKIVLRDDIIVGMTFVGEIKKSGIVYGLMRDRIDVKSFKRALLSEDFGFISFPEELRKEKLRGE